MIWTSFREITLSFILLDVKTSVISSSTVFNLGGLKILILKRSLGCVGNTSMAYKFCISNFRTWSSEQHLWWRQGCSQEAQSHSWRSRGAIVSILPGWISWSREVQWKERCASSASFMLYFFYFQSIMFGKKEKF